LISGRQTTDALRRLDIRQCARAGVLRPGHACRWIWRRGGEVTGTINIACRGWPTDLVLPTPQRRRRMARRDLPGPHSPHALPLWRRQAVVCVPGGRMRAPRRHPLWRPALCLPALPSPCLCQHARGDGRSSCQTCRPNPGPARVDAWNAEWSRALAKAQMDALAYVRPAGAGA
jgi:hypothetical protein